MSILKVARWFGVALLAAGIAGCSPEPLTLEEQEALDERFDPRFRGREGDERDTTTIWEAFSRRNTETNVAVNKYIWSASLEVLEFLPVESVDPFTGVIVTGFGRPPGGGRAYRATVLISDPALDARALNVSLQTQGGPASAATVRAVEDAILSRARQLRIADNRL